MSNSANTARRVYQPSVTQTANSVGKLRYPPPEPINPAGAGSSTKGAASAGSSATSATSKSLSVLKIVAIASLGAATAIFIAVGIIVVQFYTSTTTPTGTQTTVTTATTTSATTTTATTTTTTSTTSRTTTTTTTTATTATTTTTTTTARIWCASPCVCAGVSSYTLWQQYSTTGIYMDVSTTSCNFSQTPRYMTSISGTGNHWQLIGHNAIYSGSATTFRIYLNSIPGWSATTLQSLSTTNQWDVNWVGMYN